MSNPSLQDAENALKKYWGYDSFRPGQARAIGSVLEGQDTLVLFPTGAGKSLCYQVPAMVLEGLTVVISPLVALMQDQVDQLKRLGIRATFINSTLPGYEVEQRLVNARNGMYKLLYISPERLASERWKIEQPQLNIALIAVDEAHCVSEWGHDFRPSYRRIREEMKDLPEDVRWLALTATATPEVKEDLLQTLRLFDANVITGGFKRHNLHWWVTETSKKRDVLVKAVLRGVKLGSGIIYSNTRKECQKWADLFTKKGILTKAYHAGLSSNMRENIQTGWVEGDFPIVAATNAFGMGIDKPDCRFVVHHTLPFTLEAYYQEAGRAGRDGEPAYPVLIYRESDVDRLKARILRSYPQYEVLQKVYNGLCDELELALGSFHERTEAIDYTKLSRRIAISENELATALNVLQRLEILELTELREPQVGIRFTVSLEYLRNFIDKTDAAKSDFLDTLFRQFGSRAFSEVHFLNASNLQKKLEVTSRQLLKALKVFSDHDRLMDVHWQGERPLVRLLDARMQKLQIDHKKAYHYRDILLKKLEYMKRYAATTECREVFLRNYFGETGAKPCGKCDRCVHQQKKWRKLFSGEDLSQLKNVLKNQSRTLNQLVRETGFSKEKLKFMISYLQNEDLVTTIEEDEINYKLNDY